MNPKLAGRPDLIGDRTSLTLYDGMNGMLENTFINVKNRSKTLTAQVEIPEEGGQGVILAQGGRFGIFSADETADVGLDNQTPVAEGIGIGRDQTRFSGTIDRITVVVK